MEGIKKIKKILIPGKKIINDLLKNNILTIDTMIIPDGYIESDPFFLKIIEKFEREKSLLILKKSLYNELDVFNTGHPLCTAELPEIPSWDSTLKAGCTLAIPFQDPANTGSVIRTAAAFNISCLVLGEAASPFHPKSIRSSAGAVFTAEMAAGPSLSKLLETCRQHDVKIITLDKEGTDIREYKFPEKFLLLPGVEGPGVPPEFKSHTVSIPIGNKIESLNAAAACAIAMYEWHRGG